MPDFTIGTDGISRTPAGNSSHSQAFGTGNEATPFIPELWSDEIIAAYKANLVMANLVTKINHVGKKGDSIYVPRPNRLSANQKLSDDQVTLNTVTHNELNVLIDQHYEYSILIEDIVNVQALDSMRKFYTDDAGYALAKQVDTSLVQLGRLIAGQTGADYGGGAAQIGSDGSTNFTDAGDETALTDAGIRTAIQTLDDNDVPMDNRCLVIPPVEKKNLTGIARYTEQAFVGNGDTIRTGHIGDIYGIPVYVSTNCDTSTGGARICLLFHKEAFILAEQMGVRSQTQYKQEYLADLMTTDTIYGVAAARVSTVGDQTTSAVALAVPA